MHTQVMKWFSVAALLFAVLFWKSAAAYQLELDLVVCIAAGVVLTQAFRAKKYIWGGAFVAIALVFNPLIPVFSIAGIVGLSMMVLSMAGFAGSLVMLRPHPLMSMPSITDRNPGSRSL